MGDPAVTAEVEAFLKTVSHAAYRTWFSVNKCGVCVYCGETYLHRTHDTDESAYTPHASYCPLGPFIAAYWDMMESDDPATKAFVARYIRTETADA